MAQLKEFARQIIIDPTKLTQYALNPNNDKGRHKARVFQSVLRYTQTDYQSLMDQIQTQALTGEAQLKRVDQYGRHLQVDLLIVGPNGKRAIVRTGWLVG